MGVPGAAGRAYRILIKVGLAGYGLMHLVLGALAVRLSFGGRSEASQQGALAELATQPFGRIGLWVAAIGLFALVPWRLIDAAVGYRWHDEPRRTFRRVTAVGQAVVYLWLGVSAVRIVLGAGAGGSRGEETASARLLALPLGPTLLMAVGAVVIWIGGAQVVKGLRKSFVDDLSGAGRLTVTLGRIGFPAKGIALVLVGVLAGWAGISYDPAKAGGLDDALQALRGQAFGPVLLAAVAVGLIAFGLFCFGWARRPRVQR
ncbi:DUF1206 domain-containing protein [Microlunatus parietis]|uniref:DUF1206 domain-containing protein n=1 Tax=Microlunatus parietis TaxID=682979 RepID=A0A7Y9LAY0_9ACTN|nr:DUF1206 domain-containing protein [Microlunatus parietis]NYE73289.1 hypothetical protein [Microlunatus parietis]